VGLNSGDATARRDQRRIEGLRRGTVIMCGLIPEEGLTLTGTLNPISLGPLLDTSLSFLRGKWPFVGLLG